jgi:hypothetical protein
VHLLKLTLAALLTQTLALLAFGVAGKFGWAAGKAAVVAVAFGVMVYLIWKGASSLTVKKAIIQLPGFFAAAYLLAFHLAGMLVFPGMLSDAALSSEYMWQLLRVGAVVFCGYAAISLSLQPCVKWAQRRKPTMDA